jgi:hypothetical protein
MTTYIALALLVFGAQPALPVGSFDPRAAVVAFYRSPLFAATLKQKHAELAAAKAAGDSAKAADLERWGESSQDLAHRQLAGKAPIDNILEALRPQLPAIAAKANVSRITPQPPKGAATVDVTPYILDALQADPATRKVIADLKNRRE